MYSIVNVSTPASSKLKRFLLKTTLTINAMAKIKETNGVLIWLGKSCIHDLGATKNNVPKILMIASGVTNKIRFIIKTSLIATTARAKAAISINVPPRKTIGIKIINATTAVITLCFKINSSLFNCTETSITFLILFYHFNKDFFVEIWPKCVSKD